MSGPNSKQITRSPIDGSIYVERNLATQEQIEEAINEAQDAQKAWRKTTIETRREVCSKMVDALVKNKNEIAEQLCWMMGRPIKYAHLEVDGMAERARYMIEAATESLSPIQLPEKKGVIRYIKHEPLGVILVLAPWNYPYLTAVNTVMPAILAGNTVILKHSAQTPLCAEQFAQAFKAAQLPDGVFQYLHMSHEATQQLIANKRINHVSFTGSVSAGRMVEQTSQGQFKSIGLELGGKDPAYVRADADLSHAVETCIDGAFFNSGQSCCGIERIYVSDVIYDEFIQLAVKLIERYKLGRPDDPNTTLGPMVKASAADFVRAQIREAVEAGAKCHIDPSSFEMNEAGTPYLAPQLLTNVDHGMRVMVEESFGPVVGVMKVKSDKEAIELMNDSEFGLTAAVFSQDIGTAIAIGEQLETGTFFVNRCDYLDPALAWTGVKNSGRGCSLSRLGFQQLTRPKSFHVKTG